MPIETKISLAQRVIGRAEDQLQLGDLLKAEELLEKAQEVLDAADGELGGVAGDESRRLRKLILNGMARKDTVSGLVKIQKAQNL